MAGGCGGQVATSGGGSCKIGREEAAARTEGRQGRGGLRVRGARGCVVRLLPIGLGVCPKRKRCGPHVKRG